MAVHFYTADPSGLLNKFKTALQQAEPKGKITTWRLSQDKNHYTHTSKQWESLAWMKPVVDEQRLTFYIIKPQNRVISQTAYGFYHGHMIETFLNHFDTSFEKGTATALPVLGDLIS